MISFPSLIPPVAVLSIVAASLAVTTFSLPASQAAAGDTEELQPSDLVPRRFSVKKFTQLSDPELYEVLIAVRRGRSITIDGCTVSQSRAIIRGSAESPEAARRQAQTSCN